MFLRVFDDMLVKTGGSSGSLDIIILVFGNKPTIVE